MENRWVTDKSPFLLLFRSASRILKSEDPPVSRRPECMEERRNDMYECPCGYVYDPAVGDPDGGIAPGTAFEDIPDTWVCPICGLTKAEFTPV